MHMLSQSIPLARGGTLQKGYEKQGQDDFHTAVSRRMNMDSSGEIVHLRFLPLPVETRHRTQDSYHVSLFLYRPDYIQISMDNSFSSCPCLEVCPGIQRVRIVSQQLTKE